MNSLNLISSRVIGTPNQTPSQSRSASYGDLTKVKSRPPLQSRRTSDGFESPAASSNIVHSSKRVQEVVSEEDEKLADSEPVYDEKSPLLDANADDKFGASKQGKWKLLPQRILNALVESIRLVLSTLVAPGVYVISCLYDDHGEFAPRTTLHRIARSVRRRRGGKSTAQSVGINAALDEPDISLESEKRNTRRKKNSPSLKRSISSSSTSSAVSSDSDQDQNLQTQTSEANGPSKHTRSKAGSPAEGEKTKSQKRSIKIKVSSNDTQKRKGKKSASASPTDESSNEAFMPSTALTPENIKSPTSNASSLRMTKYPRSPAPPRPLIPRRLPYTFPASNAQHLAQKTLILDLDETLIHSLSKGGRMSTGHMVEVKLNAPVGIGGGVALGPQHPILYYVHKRPHCDEFLRKISQWYNLVVFTASVQEYADPVIDWLEQDRKYFSQRYYRQHCTFRQGNYIKDLSTVEPDLSKVMIVDNSPTSYVFHEDNAIPIEGWINDPTDNDLLHLVPLLEALQYCTDVRALLALRMGEPVAQ